MNRSPQFLTLADVFEIHLYQLVHFEHVRKGEKLWGVIHLASSSNVFL